jgi:hypothetical protein
MKNGSCALRADFKRLRRKEKGTEALMRRLLLFYALMNDFQDICQGLVLNFEHLNFEFVSDFGFRASDLFFSHH